MIEESIYKKINDFIKDIESIKWLENAGEKSDKYTVILSFIEAWDGWNGKMLEVWTIESHNLEKVAVDLLGEEMIDLVFSKIAQTIGPQIEEGFFNFQERLEKAGLDSEEYGLGFEIIDFIKRDVAWTCVESIIERKGFFTKVLEVHFEGRWPCAWDGEYPSGRFAVM